MNTKEASKKFNCSTREVRESIKFGLTNANKNKKRYDIDNNVNTILTKKMAKEFLICLLKFKNNKGYVFPRNIANNLDNLKYVLNCLLNAGYIGQYNNGLTEYSRILADVKLTENGFELINLNNNNNVLFIFNTNLNFNMMNNIALVNNKI